MPFDQELLGHFEQMLASEKRNKTFKVLPLKNGKQSMMSVVKVPLKLGHGPPVEHIGTEGR